MTEGNDVDAVRPGETGLSPGDDDFAMLMFAILQHSLFLYCNDHAGLAPRMVVTISLTSTGSLGRWSRIILSLFSAYRRMLAS